MPVKEPAAGKLVDKRKSWEARVEMRIFEIPKDELGAYDKLVYAILCGHANRAGNAWPRIGTIADEASCSERQVQRALANLEACGLLVRIPQITEADGQIANVYEIYGIDAYTPGDCQSPGGTTGSRGAGDQQSGPIEVLEQPQDNSSKKDYPPTPQAGDEGASADFELEAEKPKKPETPEEKEQRFHQGIVDAYNEILPELPTAARLSNARRKRLRALIREDPTRKDLEWWRRYFESVRLYQVPMGEAYKDFLGSFDWLLRDEPMQKILEGSYSKRLRPTGRSEAADKLQQQYTNEGGEVDAKALLRRNG